MHLLFCFGDNIDRSGGKAFTNAHAKTLGVAQPDPEAFSDARVFPDTRGLPDAQSNSRLADPYGRAQSIGHGRRSVALSFADRLWAECYFSGEAAEKYRGDLP